MGRATEVIKYEGDSHAFSWKHPHEDFDSFTQLVVQENQEAIFFMNGQALDLFGPGRYTLETQNIPKITDFFNRKKENKTAFHCAVYFINKNELMPIKWGTDSRVEYLEPTYHFLLSIGASGEMSLRIEDSRKFLIKVAGSDPEVDRQEVQQFFRAVLMTKIKTYLAHVMSQKEFTIFSIDENLSLLSENLKNLLSADFEEYGVVLERFFITTIVKPEDEEYEKYKQMYFQKESNTMKEEIYCENCGMKNHADSSFCEQCGNPLYDEQKVCSNCGYVFTRSGNFCPKCGKKRG